MAAACVNPATDTGYPRDTYLSGSVERVVDGDTLWVDLDDGGSEKIRLIGIDTPERGEPLYAEATDLVLNLAPVGSRIYLEIDQEERDRYARLLAYVWLEEPADGSAGRNTAADVRASMLNARILASGLASTLTIQPNDRYADIFKSIEQTARDRGLGVFREAA